jgi:hypothetical protein
MHIRFQSETLDSGRKADLEKTRRRRRRRRKCSRKEREELNFPPCGEAGCVPGNLAPLSNLLCDATFATLETHPCI